MKEQSDEMKQAVEWSLVISDGTWNIATPEGIISHKEHEEYGQAICDAHNAATTKLREDLALSNQMVSIESKRANALREELEIINRSRDSWKQIACTAQEQLAHQQPKGKTPEEREDYLIATEPDDPMGKRCPYCGSLSLHDDDCPATPSAPTADLEKIADDSVIFIRSLDEPARYISHEEMKRVVLKSLAQARAPLVKAAKILIAEAESYIGIGFDQDEESNRLQAAIENMQSALKCQETNKREEHK